MTGTPHTARRAAASAVQRILRSGAYSNVLVRRTAVEPPEDHAYFQRLVYSTLRHLPGIDRSIEAASNRGLAGIDPGVLAVLRVAVADLLVLGTEPHAAVNEGVSALAGRARRATPFVNAVLRSIADAGTPIGNDLESTYPQPLIARLASDLGSDAASDFLRAANAPAPVGIRFRPGGPDRGSRYATASDDPTAWEREGLVDIIDPASAAVAAALDAGPGECVVDLAAAPGGKTRAIADAVGPGGTVIAVDLHERRLARARSRSGGLAQVRWVRADALHPPFAAGTFDRVLLDAPCTGLGTLRRRPEIRFRVAADAPDRYGALQRTMLEAALPLVRPGGRLVYSVCTPFPAETTRVVDGLGFRPPAGLDAPRHGDGVLLGPDTTGTDGMFIAVHDA